MHRDGGGQLRVARGLAWLNYWGAQGRKEQDLRCDKSRRATKEFGLHPGSIRDHEAKIFLEARVLAHDVSERRDMRGMVKALEKGGCQGRDDPKQFRLEREGRRG